jgi:integrase
MKGKRRGAGEGLVRQRGDGRWEGRLSLGWNGGKRIRRSYFGATQAEVVEKLNQARHERHIGRPIAANRQTVGDYLTGWLVDIKPTMKARTHERFDELVHLHLLPELGKIRLEKLSPSQVQNLLGKKIAEGLSASTVVAIRNVLRNAINRALRWGLVARNAAALADAPRIEHSPVRVLSVDEARRLIAAIQGERFEALYSVALALGLRKGEICALAWHNLELERGQLTVVNSLQRIRDRYIADGPKTHLEIGVTKTQKSRRTIPIPQYAIRALRSHRVRQMAARLAAGSAWCDQGLVFTDPTGGPIEPVLLHRDFQRVLKRAGLPRIKFHALRHSAASLMLAQGVPLKTIQEILGHSSIAVTSAIYAHLGDELKQAAADAMDRALG